MISWHPVFLAASMLAMAAPAGLAAQPDMPPDRGERLAACAGERDDALRLACYDREVALLVPTARNPPAAAADAGASASATKSAEDNFGVYGSEVARKRDSQDDSQAGGQLKRMTATVTALSQRPRGELIVTLDNGQVWLQKKPQSYFPIEVGDEITISSGALGSFYLAASGRSTQVTRMQ